MGKTIMARVGGALSVAGSALRGRSRSASRERRTFEQDPDVVAEAEALEKCRCTGVCDDSEACLEACPRGRDAAERMQEVPLVVIRGSHRPSYETKKLVDSIGGLPKLREFTAAFYEKAFADPHIDQFLREHGDHHGERFAAWIAEKLGAGKPWTQERATRSVCPFAAYGHEIDGAHDRSSAHFAAWHSPKRTEEVWGEHFKLDDCRVWMRLHFWAAREAGVLETQFGAYYVRFIAHFVSVYERTAPSFARDAARWSADPENIRAYFENGRRMPEIMGLPLRTALESLPEHEREYTGSGARELLWPYELMVQ